MTLEELWELFPIELSEHNPEWSKWYREEEKLLLRVFGSKLERIRHIGSTAVEGLLAKPTIDILLETPENVPPASVRELALDCGYTVMMEMLEPEYRLDLCKGYTPQGFAKRVFHLHIRRIGDWDEPIFCEYLRRNPDKAREYVALKVKLQKSIVTIEMHTECQGGFYSSVREIRQGTEAFLYDSKGLVLTPAENPGRKGEIFGRIGGRFLPALDSPSVCAASF